MVVGERAIEFVEFRESQQNKQAHDFFLWPNWGDSLQLGLSLQGENSVNVHQNVNAKLDRLSHELHYIEKDSRKSRNLIA